MTALVTGQPTDAGTELGGRPQRRRTTWSRLRRDPGFWSGGVLVVIFLVIALFPGIVANVFGHGDPDACDLGSSRLGPDLVAGHPFGYTIQGCDLFTHVIHGAGNSILIGVTAAAGSAVLGLVAGLVAGYFGGWVDVLVSRLSEIVFSVPLLLGAVVLLATLGTRGPLQVAAALTLFGWPAIMRVVRASTRSVRRRNFIVASQAMGIGTVRTISRHVVPSVISPVVVLMTLSIGGIIGAESALTYLGIGLQVPSISWGLQLASAQRYFSLAPHLLVFPALALTLAVAGFVIFGESLRRAVGSNRDSL